MASTAIPAPGGSPRNLPLWLCRGLAGLDVGLFGAFLAVSWLCFHSWLRGEFWWAKLNVAGSFFYGDLAFHAGLGRVTLAGGALLILIYAVLGGILALLTPAPPRWYRSLVIGLGGALLFQLIADHWLWGLLHPFAASYFPRVASLPANLLYGLSMVRLGRRYLALGRAFGELPPPAPPPLTPPAAGVAEPEPSSPTNPAPADC